MKIGSKQVFQDLYQQDGVEKYTAKIVEELAELQVAVHHYNDNKIHIKELADEIADVHIQLNKLIQLSIELEDEYNQALQRKMLNIYQMLY